MNEYGGAGPARPDPETCTFCGQVAVLPTTDKDTNGNWVPIKRCTVCQRVQ